MELDEYEELYEILNYDTYYIIINNNNDEIIYYKSFNCKHEAFVLYNNIYNDIKYDFTECDDRGYLIIEGKGLLFSFDNDNCMLMALVGMNSINKNIHIGFNSNEIVISNEILSSSPNKLFNYSNNHFVNLIGYDDNISHLVK